MLRQPPACMKKRVIINGSDVNDVFAGLTALLKSIVRARLAPDGVLNISSVRDTDVEELKQEMLQYDVRLHVTREPRVQVPNAKGRLCDHRLIIPLPGEVIVVWFDYARLMDEPSPLE